MASPVKLGGGSSPAQPEQTSKARSNSAEPQDRRKQIGILVAALVILAIVVFGFTMRGGNVAGSGEKTANFTLKRQSQKDKEDDASPVVVPAGSANGSAAVNDPGAKATD